MKRINYFSCLITLLTMLQISVADAQAFQTQDWADWNDVSSPIFPAENWRQYQSPEEAGWSSAKLSAAQKLSISEGSAAVMVIYKGAVLAQWGQTERRFYVHSIGKSIISALYGIAVDRGDIDISETIGSIGIDDITPLTATEKSAKISDLIKARSGIYLPAADDFLDMNPKRGSYKPGTHWSYTSWGFAALATIYNQKTSGDLFNAFEKHLAVPLQMQDFELRHTFYHYEPEISRHPSSIFRMSTRDLARFGLLYLNQGLWMKKQILSSEWVRESAKPHSTHGAGGYGYMWWTNPEQSPLGKLGTYAALGYGGHMVYVVPEADLVFVHRSDTYTRKHVSNFAIEYILQEILKARTGPPQPYPNLVPLGNPQTDAPRQTLSKVQISGLTGKYSSSSEVVTVRELDGRLEISNPDTGRFFLFPKTATEFEIEDEERRVEFELNAAGIATEIRIWVRPDQPYELHRAGNEFSY